MVFKAMRLGEVTQKMSKIIKRRGSRTDFGSTSIVRGLDESEEDFAETEKSLQ